MTDERPLTEDEEQSLEPEALLAERDQLLDDLKRVAADFENYRKREARERATVYAHANERLVKELIPILDDLGRPLEAAAEHQEGKPEKGGRLGHRALAHLLVKEGLPEIETEGKVEPPFHQAR